MRAPLLATLLLALAAPAVRGAEREVRDLVGDLASPFEDARRTAAERLSRLGPAADADLLALYPRSDFRTKALILDVFARSGRPTGLELVYDDLDSEDRGVVLAQRRYVSALYENAHDLVLRSLVPFLDDDWDRREAVLALPAPAPTARKALADLADGERGPAGTAFGARLVTTRVAEIDRMRARLEAIPAGEDPDPKRSSRAGLLLRLLLRHDTERSFFAVHESGAEGYYDGMYRILDELVAESSEAGTGTLEVLLRIVMDVPFPEDGVVPDESTGYSFAERVPATLDAAGVRQLAAQALGDAAKGRKDVAFRLAAWFANGRADYDGFDSIEYPVALACAELGEDGPLREVVRTLEEHLSMPRVSVFDEEILKARLAASYTRLERYDDAVEVYRSLSSKDGVTYYNLACVLTRAGRYDEALVALRRSVIDWRYGYDPSEVVWMERDRDLDPLRDRPEYREILAAARKRLR